VIHKSWSTNTNGGMISGMKDLNSVMHKSLLKNASGEITRRLKGLNSAMHKSEGNERVCYLNPCDTQELGDECERREVRSVIEKVHI
jgi:hypothetical protein